jgi:hypothetical protein
MKSAEDFMLPGHLWDSFVILQLRYEVFRSSEMLHCVVEQILPGVAKACSALVYRVKVRVFKSGGTTIFRNVDNYLSNDTS